MSDVMPTVPDAGAHQDPNFEHIPGIKSMLRDEGLDTPEERQNVPVYKKVRSTRIPVSKHLGKVWQGRVMAAIAGREPWKDSWEEAQHAYTVDQQAHRQQRHNTSGNKRMARRKGEDFTATENVIFSAIKAIIPAIYARNPTAEFTAANDGSDADKTWCQALEKLTMTLGSLKRSPGINLKYKVKQAIISAKLMNLGWVETGYVLKEDSSDQALVDLQRLSQEYEKAEDSKRIIELEGEMMALEERVNVLAPSGPYCRFYNGQDVVADGEAMEPDFADAKWMAVKDYYPTAYLNAVYAEKAADGTYKSIYEPQVVMPATSATDRDSNLATGFRLFDAANTGAHYGYDNREAFLNAQRTACWRIYDKTTRRVMLWADNKWDWPIWVEDDKWELPNFFPWEPLLFNVSPMGPYAHSEVAHVLDQQDTINEINDAERRARFDLVHKVMFDQAGTTRDAVERVLKGTGPVAEPVKVPDGKKIDDMFYTPQPNLLKAPQLFDTGKYRQSIDGILGVTPSLRAAEYKTNTTNKAIDQYTASTNSRLDEQVDEIEEFIGRIYYNVAYLCAKFMTQEEVAQQIGDTLAASWRTIEDPKQLMLMFNMRVVGGSTTKPTSQFKQQIAVQIGQVLGQFAQAAPGAITKIVLKLFESAYDEVGISEDEWNGLDAEVNAKLGIQAQAAQPTPPPVQPGNGAGGGAPVPPAGGGAPPGIQQIAQMVDQLPPEAKIALGNAMAKGVPIVQAVQQIMQLVQQQQPSPAQPTQ